MNDLGIRFSYPVPDCPGLPEHSADAAGRWPDVENRNSVALPIAAAIRDIQINLIPLASQAAAFLVEYPDVETWMGSGEMRDPYRHCAKVRD